MVQAGLRGGHGLAQGQTTEQVFANHVRRTETLALTPGDPPDLVVWGEGAADADPLTNPDRQAAVARAAAAARAPILLGATTRLDDTHRATEALLYTPEGQLADRYQKRRLVPFGEFVPFGGVLGRLIPATREGVPYDKVPGDRLEPLLIDGVPVGTADLLGVGLPGRRPPAHPRRRPAAADHDQQRLVRDRGRAPPAPGRRAAAGGRGGPYHRPGGGDRDQRGDRTVGGRPGRRRGCTRRRCCGSRSAPRTGPTPYARYGRAVEAGLVGVTAGGLLLAGVLWRRRRGGVGRPGPSASLRDQAATIRPAPTATVPVRRETVRALVVIPTYNEAESVVEVLDRVLLADPRVDVLVVDDGSPDGTAKLVLGRGEGEPRVQLMERAGKQGLGAAYRAGFAWGLERGYDALVEMDADLSHPPDRLPALLDGLAAADLVIGSRYVPGGRTVNWSRLREAISRGGNAYVRLALRLPVHDCTAGYRAYRREVLEALPVAAVRSNGYCFQVEMAHRTWQEGFRVVEVPITFTERASGVSKMSKQIVAEALLRVTQWALTGGRRRARRPPSGAASPARAG